MVQTAPFYSGIVIRKKYQRFDVNNTGMTLLWVAAQIKRENTFNDDGYCPNTYDIIKMLFIKRLKTWTNFKVISMQITTIST